MQQGEILQILLPESKVPATTDTSSTPSGRQLIKTANLFNNRNGWLINKQTTIPLDITDFIGVIL